MTNQCKHCIVDHILRVGGYAFAHKLFAVVAGYGNLSFQLLLCIVQLSLTERTLHQSVQFVVNQSQAALHIVVVATEIYRPHPCVVIARHTAFYGI